MNVIDAIAHTMKAEGVDVLFAYPVNPLIEAAAKLDIRTVIVRQERIVRPCPPALPPHTRTEGGSHRTY